MSVNLLNVRRCLPANNTRIRCFTCLSLDRDLKPIKEKSLMAMVCPELYLNATITAQLICWECQAMILKIKHFKARVSKAQAALRRTVKGNSFFEGFSNLKSTGVETVTISPQCTNPTPPVIPTVVIPTVVMPKPMAPIKIEDEPFTTVQLKEEKREQSVSGDYDELIPLTTIQQNSSDPLQTKQKKYVEIELNTQQEVKHAFIAPNVKLNYRPQKVFNTPIQETITPRGSKEIVKVTVDVPNVVKGKKYVLPVFKGKERIPNALKDKQSVLTEVKGMQSVPTAVKGIQSVPTVVKDTGEPQLGIYYYEDVAVNCKMMNKSEMQKFRDEKRNNSCFRGSRYKCIKCLERFNAQKFLDIHNKKHDLTQGNFVCEICEQRFPENNSWERHYKAHFIIYECTQCGFKNHDGLNVSEHIHRRHQISDFDCKQCDAVFKTYREKRRHRMKVHFKKPSCKECGKLFCSIQTMRIHEATTHGGERVQCTVCKKKIKPQSLKSHMKTHEESRDDALYCVECGSTFKNKYSYTSHFKTSLKHNPIENLGFQCDECGKYFAAKITLIDHIQIKHTSGSNYACSICKKEFKSKKGMLSHIKYTHEGIKPKENKRICEICGKSFKDKSSLVHHINSHLGLRPYKCQDCGHTFSYSASLYTHRRLVHKVKKKSEMNLN